MGIDSTNSVCCRAQNRGTNQKLLLESQIDQIGVKHLEELERIRTMLETEDDLVLKDSVVQQLTGMASELENDILDYSQEFENNNLKRFLALLKMFKVNNKKLEDFDVEKIGRKGFQKFALKKVDQIIEF